VDDALGLLVMAPILEPLRRLLAKDLMADLAAQETFAAAAAKLRTLSSAEIETYLARAAELAGGSGGASTVEQAILNDAEALLGLVTHVQLMESTSQAETAGRSGSPPSVPADVRGWATALMWILVRHIGELPAKQLTGLKASDLFKKWYLRSLLVDLLIESGRTEADSRRAADAVELLLACEEGGTESEQQGVSIAGLLERLFMTDAGRRFLGIHSFNDTMWFDREAFEELAGWLALKNSVDTVAKADDAAGARVLEIAGDFERMVEIAAESGYRVDAFLDAVRADHRERPVK
jgi:hypothetical protein